MPARRKAAIAAVLGLTSPALAALSAVPASAHGSMGDPVRRVSQYYAEGPESPRSAACEAAVAAGGTQALYDWNGIRIGDAHGRHQELIPGGTLCSANSEEFKGLDLAGADWPATRVRSGSYTFKYRVTAPHKGTFTVYLTKAGYDPAQPLTWDDLDLEHPVATATDRSPPGASTGSPAPFPSGPAGSCCTRSGSARTARRRSTPARTSASTAAAAARAAVPRPLRTPPRPPRSRSRTAPAGRRSSTAVTAARTPVRRRSRWRRPGAPCPMSRGRPAPPRASPRPGVTAAPRIPPWAVRPR